MRAINVQPGSRKPTLTWSEAPSPTLQPGEVLIDVIAAGINRADLLQARGLYPPPPGTSEILGLECSGRIARVYDDSLGFAVGDEVCALLAGGGYAEQVAVPAAQVLPVPEGVSLVDAAGLPETVCTVWSNVVMTARLQRGETLLVHGGSSGIGTTAIQIGAALGATVLATAGTDEKTQIARDLGAADAFNYRTGDFVEAVIHSTDGRGADVIVDVVGGDYLQRNIAALADGGRLVIIGLMGGSKAELDIAALLTKRASVMATALRSRPVAGPGSKADIVTEVREHVWPLVAAGQVRPVIGDYVPITEAGRGHQVLYDGVVPGKVLLTVRD